MSQVSILLREGWCGGVVWGEDEVGRIEDWCGGEMKSCYRLTETPGIDGKVLVSFCSSQWIYSELMGLSDF